MATECQETAHNQLVKSTMQHPLFNCRVSNGPESAVVQAGPPKTAAALCAAFNLKLKAPSLRWLRDELSPEAFYSLLARDESCLGDARSVLAYALPKRRALWWGCLCAWDAYRPQPPDDAAGALQTVARFVMSPNETDRRAAEAWARKLPRKSMEFCLASAAFYSGGSMLKPGLPHVPPRPMMTGRLVSLAVYLASLEPGPAGYRDRLKQYLAIGLELAQAPSLDLTATTAPAPVRLDSAAQPHGPHVGAAAARAAVTTFPGELS